MKTIIFQVEYMAPPFFNPSSDDMGHVEINDLPISKELYQAIKNFDAKFQKTLNKEYPPDSYNFTISELLDFNKHGNYLAKLLQEELGDTFFVIYKPLRY